MGSMENVAGVEEDVAAVQIQSQMKKQSKKADRGQQHGKKEPTVACDKNDSASMENVAGVEEDVAAVQIQKQKNHNKQQTKKTDRGQQHGKEGLTVAFTTTILRRGRRTRRLTRLLPQSRSKHR